MTERAAAAAALLLVVALAACGRSEPAPKTPEQVAAEQAAAREKAKQGALGEQIETLDKAATVEGTVADQAEATRDAVDAQTGDASAQAPATTPPP